MIQDFSLSKKIAFLKQIPIFKKLSWLELRFIACRATIEFYSKGSLIYKRGDPPDAFYCIVSGRLMARNSTKDGRSRDVEYLYRGMYFGVVSLLTGEPHSLTFETLNDSLLLKIDQEAFKEILTKIPKCGVDFTYSLSRRLKRCEQDKKKIFESTIISVYSSEHGSRTSCYASHLAFQISKETGKKVLFVDILRGDSKKALSPLGPFSPRWHVDPIDFKKMLNWGQNPLDAIHPCEGLDLLYVSADGCDQDFSKDISHFVSNLANDYHFIILDLPNAMDDFVFTSLVQSDEVHLLTRDAINDFDNIKNLLDRFRSQASDQHVLEKLKIFVADRKDRSTLPYDKINNIIGKNIYAKLPWVQQEDVDQVVASAVVHVSFPSKNHPFTCLLKKTAREIAGVRVGLVLGGGAAFGFAHIGALEVFEKENIPIDVIVGSSAGSIIAGFWALGANAQTIAQWAREFQNRYKCLSLLDMIFPRSGLLAGWQIERWLRSKIGGKTFYETRIPLKIVSYDILNREEIVIDHGDVVRAIRKSISIPGVMRPVVEEDNVLVDGAIFNPLPTNVLTGFGIQKIIAINILKSPEDIKHDRHLEIQKRAVKEKAFWAKMPLRYLARQWKNIKHRTISPNIFDILVNSFLAIDYTLAEQGAQHADVLIHPDLKGFEWYELYRVDEIMEQGRQAAYQALPAIRRLVHNEA